jgi:hypothetical protein
MKKVFLLLLLAGSQAAAQEQAAAESQASVAETNLVERTDISAPTYSDVYCAGFLSREDLNDLGYVEGGDESPHTTRFGDRAQIFLHGEDFKVGQRYSIIRELRDPNRAEPFPGQGWKVRRAGQPYSDMGWVTVTAIRGEVAVAKVDFSCDTIMPGDKVIAFVERPKIVLRQTPEFDRFPAEQGKTQGRIVMGRDFDALLGTGGKVYLDVGTEDGIRVGDYFRITRTYQSIRKDEVDSLSFKASIADDTQKNPPDTNASMFDLFGSNVRMKNLPRKAVGELIVLSVTPRSATGMITFAREEVKVGDDVDSMDLPGSSQD